MATQPDSSPDTIQPQSPDEVPSFPSDPAPQQQPAETPPLAPDYDQPDRTPLETPPPPD